MLSSSSRAALAVALQLVLVGCIQPTATTPESHPVDTGAIMTDASISSSRPSPGPQSLNIAEIPTQFTTPALAYESDGVVLLWSSSAPSDPENPAADLWIWRPGGGDPQKVFNNPNRGSSLPIIRGDGAGHYAFVEQNATLYGPAGWRLWYLREPGAGPVLLDKGDVEAGLLPFPAMNGERVVWTALHLTDHGVQSQLLQWSVNGGDPVVLDAVSAEQREFLHPSVYGHRLAYTTIDVNSARTGLTSAVWMRELSDPRSEAEKVSGEEGAFMGVLGQDVLVWQSPTFDNPFNGGTLVLYDLGDGTSEAIGSGGAPVTWHTVGSRFVVGETEDVTLVEGYDLVDRTVVLLDRADVGAPGTREAVDVRPRVAGNLLVFVRGSDNSDTELILKWANLPARM